MAVQWGCPDCGARGVAADPFALDTLHCPACAGSFERASALCIVCDAPGALRLRDSIHVQCRVCGEMQMIFARVG